MARELIFIFLNNRNFELVHLLIWAFFVIFSLIFLFLICRHDDVTRTFHSKRLGRELLLAIKSLARTIMDVIWAIARMITVIVTPDGSGLLVRILEKFFKRQMHDGRVFDLKGFLRLELSLENP